MSAVLKSPSPPSSSSTPLLQPLTSGRSRPCFPSFPAPQHSTALTDTAARSSSRASTTRRPRPSRLGWSGKPGKGTAVRLTALFGSPSLVRLKRVAKVFVSLLRGGLGESRRQLGESTRQAVEKSAMPLSLRSKTHFGRCVFLLGLLSFLRSCVELPDIHQRMEWGGDTGLLALHQTSRSDRMHDLEPLSLAPNRLVHAHKRNKHTTCAPPMAVALHCDDVVVVKMADSATRHR